MPLLGLCCCVWLPSWYDHVIASIVLALGVSLPPLWNSWMVTWVRKTSFSTWWSSTFMASWFLENFPFNCLTQYLCNSSSFHFLDTEYLHTLWRLKESSVKTCDTKHYTFWPLCAQLWHLTDISYFALSPFARESANTTAALYVSQCLHFISPCWCTQAHCHVWSMLESPCFCCQANTLCWQSSRNRC